MDLELQVLEEEAELEIEQQLIMEVIQQLILVQAEALLGKAEDKKVETVAQD